MAEIRVNTTGTLKLFDADDFREDFRNELQFE